MSPFESRLLSLQSESAELFSIPIKGRLILNLDLSIHNPDLTSFAASDMTMLEAYVEGMAAKDKNPCGGGYGEERKWYSRGQQYHDAAGVRSVHLGLDFWLAKGSEVFSPLDGIIHSFADNQGDGDYGPTLILEHHFADDLTFFSLYGHLSRSSMAHWEVGARISKGARMGTLGSMSENGNWPPHLHFQLIRDLGGRKGDFPGVCLRAERERWMEICPDPNLLLGINWKQIRE